MGWRQIIEIPSSKLEGYSKKEYLPLFGEIAGISLREMLSPKRWIYIFPSALLSGWHSSPPRAAGYSARKYKLIKNAAEYAAF